MTLLLTISCECGVETIDKDKDKSSSEPTPIPTVDVVLASPQDGATNVPFSSSFDIIVDFDKNIQFNEDSTSEFSFISNGGDESNGYTFSHTDPRLSIQSNQFRLHLNQVLSGGTEYTFTIPENTLLQDTEDGSKDNVKNEEVTLTFTTAEKSLPMDTSFFSVSGGDTWYEQTGSDIGDFASSITIRYPTGVQNSGSSASFPVNNKWENQVASNSSTVTIAGLPDGIQLFIVVVSPGVLQLRLFGNASSHERIVDNTSFTLTFPDGFFAIPNHYTSADVTFSFNIVFGTYYGYNLLQRHQALEYDDKLWILGGTISINRVNNIWVSENEGDDWNDLTVNGLHWEPRRDHQALIYNNKLWIIGGHSADGYLNDIWTSADGTNWHEITVNGSHWSPRRGFQAFDYDGAMYVLGGEDTSGVTNDIWTSTDNGTNWAKIAVVDTHWTGGLGCQAFAYDDKLWVLGGASANSDSTATDEIWYSINKGTNWSQVVVNDATHWTSRYVHQSFTYDDKIWVLGGKSGSSSLNDIWNSTNKGTNWTKVDVQGGLWSGRTDFQAFPYDDKIWVLGGRTITQTKQDTWSSSNEGVTWTEALLQFY